MSFQGIRHIIFDLGGVILNIDYQATEKAFEALGIQDFRSCFSQLSQNAFFDDWETGKITEEQFIYGLQTVAGETKITREQIINAWNAMLLDFPKRRLQILNQLHIHYDLFLLSNTNEIHEKAFNEILKRDHGIPSLYPFFDKIYFSHRVQLRKPGAEIFIKILEENNLDPAKTLFIDDSPQHLDAAKKLGIQVLQASNSLGMEEIFRSKNG